MDDIENNKAQNTEKNHTYFADEKIQIPETEEVRIRKTSCNHYTISIQHQLKTSKIS